MLLTGSDSFKVILDGCEGTFSVPMACPGQYLNGPLFIPIIDGLSSISILVFCIINNLINYRWGIVKIQYIRLV